MQKKHNEHIEGAIGPANPPAGLDIGVWHVRQIRLSPPQCAYQRLYLRRGLEGYTQVAGNDWVMLNMIWLCAAKVIRDGCVEDHWGAGASDHGSQQTESTRERLEPCAEWESGDGNRMYDIQGSASVNESALFSIFGTQRINGEGLSDVDLLLLRSVVFSIAVKDVPIPRNRIKADLETGVERGAQLFGDNILGQGKILHRVKADNGIVGAFAQLICAGFELLQTPDDIVIVIVISGRGKILRRRRAQSREICPTPFSTERSASAKTCIFPAERIAIGTVVPFLLSAGTRVGEPVWARGAGIIGGGRESAILGKVLERVTAIDRVVDAGPMPERSVFVEMLWDSAESVVVTEVAASEASPPWLTSSVLLTALRPSAWVLVRPGCSEFERLQGQFPALRVCRYVQRLGFPPIARGGPDGVSSIGQDTPDDYNLPLGPWLTIVWSEDFPEDDCSDSDYVSASEEEWYSEAGSMHEDQNWDYYSEGERKHSPASGATSEDEEFESEVDRDEALVIFEHILHGANPEEEDLDNEVEGDGSDHTLSD
ncbi:hypothetical protein C8J57DRAFT_1229642 [Mycena rebaudengoi]|nr:hypothetical protein C8J57DRAFT_1229642 [Mycena rebaudengoi]